MRLPAVKIREPSTLQCESQCYFKGSSFHVYNHSTVSLKSWCRIHLCWLQLLGVDVDSVEWCLCVLWWLSHWWQWWANLPNTKSYSRCVKGTKQCFFTMSLALSVSVTFSSQWPTASLSGTLFLLNDVHLAYRSFLITHAHTAAVCRPISNPVIINERKICHQFLNSITCKMATMSSVRVHLCICLKGPP